MQTLIWRGSLPLMAIRFRKTLIGKPIYSQRSFIPILDPYQDAVDPVCDVALFRAAKHYFSQYALLCWAIATKPHDPSRTLDEKTLELCAECVVACV